MGFRIPEERVRDLMTIRVSDPLHTAVSRKEFGPGTE